MALRNKICPNNIHTKIADWMQWVSSEYVRNTTRLDFDWSMETMRHFVGLTNNARGYPGSILVCVLTNSRCLSLVGLIIVTQCTLPTASVSGLATRAVLCSCERRNLEKKCTVAKSLWTESRSE